MHKIDAAESDYLYCKLSQIPNSGAGLYTAIDLFKGEFIALFRGKIVSELEAKKLSTQGKDRYFIRMIDGSTMDSMHTKCFAKYANDAKGMGGSMFKNNTKITLNEEGRVCLQALKNIKAGEELFCGYGSKYWKKQE